MDNDDATPAAFLAQLGEQLKTRKNEDVELAALVVKHILIPGPAEDCVHKAMAAINILATSRATPSKKDADG